jgi:hypothetical protein
MTFSLVPEEISTRLHIESFILACATEYSLWLQYRVTQISSQFARQKPFVINTPDASNFCYLTGNDTVKCNMRSLWNSAVSLLLLSRCLELITTSNANPSIRYQRLCRQSNPLSGASDLFHLLAYYGVGFVIPGQWPTDSVASVADLA